MFPSVGMVDDTRVAAALSRLPVVVVDKVEAVPGNAETAGGNAGGGGGEVGVGVAPLELVGSGDGVASGTEVLFRSTCGTSFGQTLF